eukprot:TRINITY_DN8229_c0_g1_i1.p1 TRINITY_DN8229_c0_g1~~TRINITY_DN8229_c0_g1_i1.p1  ORF type:complete len:1211 (+),score=289.99 TRINITY_DN8229_c0_g1_i1:76-3708(+)
MVSPSGAAAASPAADFGSLSAFLGMPIPGANGLDAGMPWAQPKKGCSSSKEPPSTVTGRQPKDATSLNKKMAFKMLKQLGCEVKRSMPENEGDEVETYIEINNSDQPVLFKMLLDFGYSPQREGGVGYIRIKEPRRRRAEELVADLSAPKRPMRQHRERQQGIEEPETEHWPSMQHARLRPEDERELVNRLAKPRIPKSREAPPSETPPAQTAPKRSAAEQRAYIDRLTKPRNSENDLPTELAEAAAAAGLNIGGSSGSKSRPGIVWPTFGSASSSSARSSSAPVVSPLKSDRSTPSTARTAPSKTTTVRSPSPGLQAHQATPIAPVRPSPRLAQAGLIAVRGGSGASSPDDMRVDSVRSASPASDASLGSEKKAQSHDLARGLSAAFKSSQIGSGRSSPSSKANVDEQKEEVIGGVGEAAASTAKAAESPTDQEEKTGDWLDRLLGPSTKSWPGRAAEKRSAAEMRERLEKLSKPKKREEPAPASGEVNRPTRSPRSQREACSRLAAHKKPVSMQSSAAESAENTDDELDVEDELSDEDLGDPDWSPGDPGGAQRPVKIVPSLLAQCPSRLERIDEEQSEAAFSEKQRQAQGRKRLGAVPGRARSQGAPHARNANAVAAPYATPVVPKSAFSKPPSGANRIPRNGNSGQAGARNRQQPGACSGTYSTGADDDDDDDDELTPEELTKLAGLLVASDNADEAAQGEAMLANIDALYTQLLGGSQASYDSPFPNGDDPGTGMEEIHQHHHHYLHHPPQASSGGYPPSSAPEPSYSSRSSPSGSKQMPEDSLLKAAPAPAPAPLPPTTTASVTTTVTPTASTASSSTLAAPLPPPATRAAPSTAASVPVTEATSSSSSSPSNQSVPAPLPPATAATTTSAAQSPSSKLERREVRAADSSSSDYHLGDEGGDGEQLLANIDRLYGEMLKGGRHPPREAYEAATAFASGEADEDDFSFQKDGPTQQMEENGHSVHHQGHDEETEAEAAAAAAELPSLLEEVLWSALLLGRGAAGSKRSSASGTGAQSRLLDLLPAQMLSEACRRSGSAISSSTRQRLASELPELHAAVTAEQPDESSPIRKLTTTSLLRSVREARDGLLFAASSPRTEVETELPEAAKRVRAPSNKAPTYTAAAAAKDSKAQKRPTSSNSRSSTRPGSAEKQPASSERPSAGPKPGHRAKSRAKRSSLSYWTSDAFEELEAPNQRVAKQLNMDNA